MTIPQNRILDPAQIDLRAIEKFWQRGASVADISREMSIPASRAQDYVRKIARKYARLSLRKNIAERRIKSLCALECGANSVFGPAATSEGQARRPGFNEREAHMYQIRNPLARRIDSDGGAKRLALARSTA